MGRQALGSSGGSEGWLLFPAQDEHDADKDVDDIQEDSHRGVHGIIHGAG